MDKSRALTAFAALSQPMRLDTFRLLMRAGPKGMVAGEIATTLGVRQNTLSANLSLLQSAGLIRNQRAGRTIIYSIDLDGTRDLLGFLMEDCCGGRPELCRPVIDQIACAC